MNSSVAMGEAGESRIDWVAGPALAPLRGRVAVPGDKSVSHRAVMFSAIAEGTTHVRGFLEGADTQATARVMQQLGVRIETPAPGERVIHGVGLRGLRGANADLDCGNAGTAMRLLCGLLSGQGFGSRLVGDASLSSRPMERVAAPLRLMGADLRLGVEGRPPVVIARVPSLVGIRYESPVASAQVKSALLLAGLYAQGETEVIEPAPTRDYTETLLQAMGADIEFQPGHARLRGGVPLRARDCVVPADFSSAAFALVAALLVPGSEVILPAVGVHPRRTGLLEVLRLMGGRIESGAVEAECADLHVLASDLQGIEVPLHCVPDMIDEFPILFVAAACASGVTRVRGAAELRVKESDRIAVMAQGLRALGIRVDERPDGADIHGGALHGGVVDAHGDHRIAMAFAVAAQRASGPVQIRDVANVQTSYPGFAASMARLGLTLA